MATTVDEDKHHVLLGFNVDVLPAAAQKAEDEGVRVFDSDVIYQLVEDYEAFVEAREREQKEAIFENIVRPARFRILKDHVFRQNDPAVVGVEVVSGTLKRNTPVGLMEGNDLDRVGVVKGIQDQGEDVDEARAGNRVSVSIDGPTVGRDIEEGDELWVDLPEKHAKVLDQELSEEIPADEREALKAYLDVMRKRDPFWGK